MESLRTRWRSFLWQFKKRSLKTVDEDFYHQSAMIFSPHQDDETLGCGGLITQKRAIHTPVKIVMMTDGSRSHSQFLAVDELVKMRAAESYVAAECLGVDVEDLIHLGYEDGHLSEYAEDAISRISTLILEERPQQLFIPYAGDWQSEHQATRKIVRAACRESGLTMEIYEYPVWFWYHWPWVMFPSKIGRSIFRFVWTSLAFGYGMRFLHDFRVCVPISDVIEEKRDALTQYHSQMTKMISGTLWPTLPEISNGEFLACFFQEYEIFHRCDQKYKL